MYAILALLVAVIAPIPTVIRNIKQRVTPFRTVINGVVAAAIGALVIMVIGQASGHNVFAELKESAEMAAEMLASMPEMAQMLGGDVSEKEVYKLVMTLYDQAIQLFPTTICVFAAIAAYIEYIILSKIYKPGGIAAIPMTPMRELNLPRNIVTVWLVLYLLSLFITGTEGAAGEFVISNITSIFDMLFMLQGMSLIFMFCYSKRITKVIAVIVIIILLNLNMGNFILTIMGFVDILFGIKYRLKQRA